MAILTSKHDDQASRSKSRDKLSDALENRPDINTGNLSALRISSHETDGMPDRGAMTLCARQQNNLNENAAADNPRGGVDAFTEVSAHKASTAANYEDLYPIIAKHWGVTS